MFSLSFVTVALALVGASASNASPLEPRACPPYEIITARGTSAAQGDTTGYTGMLNQALASLPGSTHYDVVYPASLDFYNSIQAGARDLGAHIRNGITFCPNQKYALIGYSQGAEVINTYLQDVTPSNNANIYNQIKAVVHIGNPSHSPYNPSNYDENGGRTTDPYAGGGIAGFKTQPLTAYIYSGKLRDICYNYDTICAFTEPKPSGPAQSGNHFAYNGSASVQSQGANHIVSKLTAA
ncbi:hypothetical protein OC846_002564 [Tilletia horrida]|uniref:Cutinase n=1 Tax=Tilletia horrida TaxID=155126 RepID=A0AAN6JUS8_9BASI|nr:hypothetical protein OC846_002564 [Tilletia horrida]KAK0567706.1 hypothetical protein OC861_002560 [Tilletia horrida]